MSAYCNLVGLYPTDKATSIVEYPVPPLMKPWQPIPVHTVPKAIDHLLGVSNCPRYEELVEELRQSDRIKRINNAFKDLFTFLEESTGEKIPDLFFAWDIADTMVIQLIESCSCPIGIKVYSCKQSVGLAILFNSYQRSDKTRIQPLAKRK
ncbi:unnamed protein product, partial [Didymodactylos carnosus]